MVPSSTTVSNLTVGSRQRPLRFHDGSHGKNKNRTKAGLERLKWLSQSFFYMFLMKCLHDYGRHVKLCL